jgi:pyruvate formate lyase activating enzyme
MDVQCDLCPKACAIAPGRSGECRIRVNVDGVLLAVTYGRPCSVHVDPVEKKPLFHFLPGTKILSLATVGCNLHCRYCQNWEISQENPENVTAYRLPPADVAVLAKREGCPSVAYTYSEPLVYYEYTLDSSVAARREGLKNVLVTAGYANRAPLERLFRVTDAANIDLKGFTEEFYRDVCGATLRPVLDALVLAKSMGVLVEVTNLVVPTLNDRDEDFRPLCRWIARNLGRETPLHFSGFSPKYRMKNLPPTPAAALDRARAIALEEGLHFVYIGNLLRPDGETTFCPGCRKPLVERRGFEVLQNRIRSGQCPDCRTKIYGIWE